MTARTFVHLGAYGACYLLAVLFTAVVLWAATQ